MTDLEITKACAEAMGVEVGPVPNVNEKLTYLAGDRFWLTYDPLHDDAQCLALVKRFRLPIFPRHELGMDAWQVGTGVGMCYPDLNRTICEHVAKWKDAK